jgi:hypothetical protein
MNCFNSRIRRRLIAISLSGSALAAIFAGSPATAQTVAPTGPTSPAPAGQQSPPSLPTSPVTTDDATVDGTASGAATTDRTPAQASDSPDIVVTGSYLNVRQEDRASPVKAITAADFNRTGVGGGGGGPGGRGPPGPPAG